MSVKSKLTGQWIKKMKPKTGKKGKTSGYKIEGFYADIWSILQVSLNVISS